MLALAFLALDVIDLLDFVVDVDRLAWLAFLQKAPLKKWSLQAAGRTTTINTPTTTTIGQRAGEKRHFLTSGFLCQWWWWWGGGGGGSSGGSLLTSGSGGGGSGGSGIEGESSKSIDCYVRV